MRRIGVLWLALLLAPLAPRARGGVSEEEAARLDADLTPLGAERAGERRRHHPGVDGRHHRAAAGLPPGRAPPRPLSRAIAILYTVTAADLEARGHLLVRRPEGAAARPPRELAPARLSDAPLRLLPRTGCTQAVRANATRAQCRARGQGIGRGRAGGPAVPDSAERRRGGVEPQPALARRARRAQRGDRRGDAPGQLPRGAERADARPALRGAAVRMPSARQYPNVLLAIKIEDRSRPRGSPATRRW